MVQILRRANPCLIVICIISEHCLLNLLSSNWVNWPLSVYRWRTAKYGKAKVRASKEVSRRPSTLDGNVTWSTSVGRTLDPNLGLTGKENALINLWSLLWVGNWRRWQCARCLAVSSLTSPMYKHHSLHNIWCNFTKVQEEQRYGTELGKSVKCMGTGKQYARHVEIIHSYPHGGWDWDSRGWHPDSEVCSRVTFSTACQFPEQGTYHAPQVVKGLPHTGSVTWTIQDHISFPWPQEGELKCAALQSRMMKMLSP